MAQKSFKDELAENPALKFISSAQPQESQEKKTSSLQAVTKKAKSKVSKDAEVKLDGLTDIPVGYQLTKENKSKKVTALVRPSVWLKAKEKATQECKSLNDVLNTLLEQYIA
jgi:regulatory protein YycH of two-component signal transduction system YycFG